MNTEELQNAAYSFSSLSEKTRESNHFVDHVITKGAVSTQLFKLIRPRFRTPDLSNGSPMLNQLSQPVGKNYAVNLKYEILYFCCVRGTRTQPQIFLGCSVNYYVSCAIKKRRCFEVPFALTYICLALRCLLTFCLTSTR